MVYLYRFALLIPKVYSPMVRTALRAYIISSAFKVKMYIRHSAWCVDAMRFEARVKIEMYS